MTAGESSTNAGLREGEDGRLADSVGGLERLDPSMLPLAELLTRVARLAVAAIPGADGAGLTLLEDGGPDTMVATADFVSVVDAVQYGLGDGPCIAAAREARTIVSGSLGEEARWGTFGHQVAELGVHSVVSLPLRLGGEVLGAMNVYAHAFDAFDARAAELGEAFAGPAAVAVQHAHVLDRTRRFAERWQAALGDRTVVEQAIGVLMGRDDLDLEEAQSRLEQLAQQRREPLALTARAVVDEAVHRTGADTRGEGGGLA